MTGIVELRVNDALWILDPVARKVWARYRTLEHDELVSVGYIALRKAAEDFDETLDVAFSSYAWIRVFGAMMDLVRKEVGVASSICNAGAQALTLLDDRGDIMRDDEPRHQITAEEYLSAVAAAMRANVLSVHSGSHASGMIEEQLDRRNAYVRLREALKTLASNLAQLIEMHYMRAITLRSIAEQLEIHYRTAKRWHNDALHALASALSRAHTRTP